MTPVPCNPCSSPFRKLAGATALIGALCGAPVFAQEVPMAAPGSLFIFNGLGAGVFLPRGTVVDSGGPPPLTCSSTHYHGALPDGRGAKAGGCGWGMVAPLLGGSVINLNQPSGSLIDGGGGPGLLEFGGELGGPIIKDRLWFWGSGNRNKIVERANLGFERTFLDGQSSVGVRIPFVQIQGVQVITDDLGAIFDLRNLVPMFPPNPAGLSPGLAPADPSRAPFSAPPAGAPFTFTTFAPIVGPDGNAFLLGIPIDVFPLAVPSGAAVQPPTEDLDTKAQRELREAVQRMSPEDRQNALKDPRASEELKKAVREDDARYPLAGGINATDAFRSQTFSLGAEVFFK